MTDKEKLEKIVAYLMRRMYAHNHKADIGSTGEIFDEKIENAKYEECRDTLNFIDSMQEEPKECMYSKDNYTDEDRKVLCEGCEEECKFNKKEEPVNNGLDLGCGVIWRDKEPISEDLEQEINEFVSILTERRGDFPKLTKLGFRTIARHFSNWQKQKDESYTKSMYKVGVNTGKELIKQQLMAKAVDAVVKIDAGGYPYIDRTIELYDYDKDIPFAKEGDKYKVILIKEDKI